MMTLCIDATNLTEGGGITHLKEIINNVVFQSTGFDKVIVYSSEKTLDQLPGKEWLQKKTHPLLNKGLFERTWYLFFYFKKQLFQDNCSILFNPGGGYSGSFHPYVTMCRNMLVFDSKERARYGFRKIFWRLKLLEILQGRSLQKAAGIIFISEYARKYVTQKENLHNSNIKKIHHGVSERFHAEVKSQKKIESYLADTPYRLLYVSIVDVYKHQWQVVKAVQKLRERDGFQLELHLVGSAYPPALKILQDAIKEADSGSYVQYHGNLRYEELHKIYHNADAFVFASSCENMPNILFEAMNAGLPIACSKREPMPEFLKDAGWYFDPEKDESIYEGLKDMLNHPQERESRATKASEYAAQYSWAECAEKTFQFLYETGLGFKK